MTGHWAVPLPSAPDYATLAHAVGNLVQLRNEQAAIAIRAEFLRQQIREHVAELEALVLRRVNIERALQRLRLEGS